MTHLGNAQEATNFINGKKKINHLMYMDGIKLFAKYDKELGTLIQAVRIYNEDIWMGFGIEKCAILIMKSRKLQMTEGIDQPNKEKKNRTLGEKETYKYLGILETGTIKQDERKNSKRISQENEKTSQNQTI